MGDAVLEIYVRKRLIQQGGGKPHQLHRKATSYVSAKAQAMVLHAIYEQLSEEEQWLVKRGRNTKPGTVPKNTNVMEYRYSSGFECMIGYLYLSEQQERLDWIMEQVFKTIEEGD